MTMTATGRRYTIITPARDEEEHIRGTLDSVVQQTVRPQEWILIDDGSSDGTGAILDEYSHQHPWISVVHLRNRGTREPGTGVIAAFYEGFRTLRHGDWDYLVKLDADLSFEPDYFERCLEHFEAEPQLGLGGGMVQSIYAGVPKLEQHPLFHVRGATKIYRRACWDALGGLLIAPGWDTLDEIKANMLGWKTRSFEELKLTQYRPTGAAQGIWRNAVKNGRANYIVGYHPLFMLFKCLRRLLQPPYLVDGAGLFFGFLGGYLGRVPQINDRELIRYLRSQQVRRLLLQESLWK